MFKRSKTARIWALVMSAMLLSLPILTACAPQVEQPVDKPVTTPESTAPIDPASDLEGELEVWIYEFFYDEGENSAIVQLSKKFTDANPGVKVSFIPVAPGSSTFRDKYIQAAQGGSGPDVIISDVAWVSQLGGMDLILSLNDFFTNQDDFMPGMLEAVTYNGEVYSVPWNSGVLLLYYNKDMFKAAGLDPQAPPKTWEEFRNYSLQVKNNEMDAFGLLGGWGGSYEWLPWLWQNGGDILDENGNIAFNNEIGYESVEFFLNLIVKDKIIPDSALAWKGWDELAAGFTTQAFAMCEGTDAFMNNIAAVGGADFEIGVAPLPGNVEQATILGGHGWCVNKNSADAQLAYKWIEFMSSEESLAVLDAYGRLSARVDADHQAIVQNEMQMKAAFESMPYARPRLSIPEWSVIDYDCIQVAFMQVIFEGRDIESAMKEAAEKAEAALQG